MKLLSISFYWKLLYTFKSVSDKGTLYQLRNVVNRKNVGEDPTKDMNAQEDFSTFNNQSTKTHVIAATMELWNCPTQCVDVGSQWEKEYPSNTMQSTSRWVCSHPRPFRIREGDGSRVLICWKFLFLIFRENSCTNYSIEAFIFLVQHAFLFSPHQSQQLLQSRFVNVHGLPSKNVSCDLHMEHLNRLLKTCIATLGPNKILLPLDVLVSASPIVNNIGHIWLWTHRVKWFWKSQISKDR